MRSPGDIKREILIMRDLKKLPLTYICEQSRVSRHQLTTALMLDATEDVQRRLDAFLDAKHLHVQKKSTELLWRVERNDRELYRVYGAKTRHILTVQGWSKDQQRRQLDAMDYRLKRLLKRVLELKGFKNERMPDGVPYWRWKALVCRKHPEIAVVLGSGDARGLLRADPMGKSRFL